MHNNSIGYILAFLSGAAVGSVVAWKMLKTKYEKLAQEEIDSVREVYAKKQAVTESNETEEVKPMVTQEKPNIMDYAKRMAEMGYIAYSDVEKIDKKKGELEPVVDNTPYVLSPSEFGENPEYETVTLTYYADGRLADDMDELIEDIDDVVGVESLDHFGDYEDDPDTVYVRNNGMKTDYEICLDTRRYIDVVGDTMDVTEEE